MRGLFGDDFTTAGRTAGGTGRLDPEESPPPPGSPETPAAAPSMVRSIPFSRQSCRLSRKRLLLLDMEGEGGGDAAGCCFGASPADWVRESSLLEGGTDREDVVVGVAVVAAVDVAAAAAAAIATAGSSWLWVMLW